ncbi:MAG: YhbY family RNA-binding protein [Clostridiales bacterium]|nr:YhbY family RNA-binding protein [Clostridiales bacterium]
MLNSKHRAALRALANGEETIVFIGKGGITDNVVHQAADALKARELIKCRVLENSLLSAREACNELSLKTGAEQVQVIGSRFVLYLHNPEKKDGIKL